MQNLRKILDVLNIYYIDRNSKITGPCPAADHPGDGDNQFAFSFDLHKEIWCCFSHHCELDVGSDIIGLIRAVLNSSFHEALDWLDNLVNTNQLISVAPAKKQQLLQEEILNKINEDRLKFLSKDVSFLFKKGFSQEVLERYQVGFWSRLGTFMHDRIVVPIRDSNGYLVGFSGRTIYEKEQWVERHIEQKWKHGSDYVQHVPNSFKIGNLLFNLCWAKEHLGDPKTLILVEGPLDGLKLEMADIHNWAAIMGSSLSLAQKNLLIGLNLNKLILLLDGDKPGIDAAHKIQRQLKDYFNVALIIIPDGKDPGDLEVNQLKELVCEK